MLFLAFPIFGKVFCFQGNIDRGGKVWYTLYDNVKGIKRYEKTEPKTGSYLS